MNKKAVIALIILIVAGLMVLAAAQKRQENVSLDLPADRMLLKVAPEFTLITSQDTEIKLSDYKNKVVFLNMFSVGCKACQRQIKDFSQLYAQYKDRDFVVLGAFLDDLNPQEMKSAEKILGIDYPSGLIDERTVNKYGGVVFIPTTVIINKEGSVVNKYIGYAGKDMLEAQIKRLIQ